MKNRYFILSMLFWAIASVCLAISLPSSSYTSQYSYSVETFTISTGATFGGSMLRNSISDEVGLACGEAVNKGNYDECTDCCIEQIPDYNANEEQNKKYGNCMTSCEGWALNEEDTPIGETLILIPFALAYAVIRRRKEAVMA